jgi:hypothetical protein
MFPEGFHRMTMDELRKRCVDDFPKSNRRGMIMDGLERMVTKLISVGLDECELWIDGSFLTVKPEPGDVDIVLFAPSQFWDKGTNEQTQTLEWLEDEDRHEAIKQEYYCDAHAFPLYPEKSSLHVFSLAGKAEWHNTYGRFLVSGDPKGIAVFHLAQPRVTPKKAGA